MKLNLYYCVFVTTSPYNATLNAGKIAAVDGAGMEHDSDDSNVIHIKMKVGDFLLDSVHFEFQELYSYSDAASYI